MQILIHNMDITYSVNLSIRYGEYQLILFTLLCLRWILCCSNILRWLIKINFHHISTSLFPPLKFKTIELLNFISAPLLFFQNS